MDPIERAFIVSTLNRIEAKVDKLLSDREPRLADGWYTYHTPNNLWFFTILGGKFTYIGYVEIRALFNLDDDKYYNLTYIRDDNTNYTKEHHEAKFYYDNVICDKYTTKLTTLPDYVVNEIKSYYNDIFN